MSLEWLTWSNPVSIWWAFLISVSAVNILIWVLIVRHIRTRDFSWHPARWHIKAMAVLSAFYVFGCAFRAALPRADIPRLSLFDTWLSSVLVGRSVATIAELAFVMQWAIALHYLSRLTGFTFGERVAFAIVPLIVLAEASSWYAVVSIDFFWNAVENTIWGITFTLVAIALWRLRTYFHRAVRKLIVGVVVGLIAYVIFLAVIDVPMYIDRWQLQLAGEMEFFGIGEGLRNLNSEWIVSDDLAHWQEEIPWMSLYFSLAVWSSLALIVVALLKHRLPEFLKK